MKKEIIILLLGLAGMWACVNDTQPVDEQEAEQQQVADSASVTLHEERVDTPATAVEADSAAGERKEDALPKKPVKKTNNKVIEKPVVPKEEKKEMTEEEKRRARDLDSELNDVVNNNPNPDNFNGVGEIADESSYNFKLIPVYNEADLGYYYVQFAVEAEKMSRAQIAAKIKGDDTVYVVLHDGLFKYSMGKSKTEAGAQAKMKQLKKKYRLEEAEVVTYRAAW